jgi:hypothetical protein
MIDLHGQEKWDRAVEQSGRDRGVGRRGRKAAR